jgi:hypothetical protein
MHEAPAHPQGLVAACILHDRVLIRVCGCTPLCPDCAARQTATAAVVVTARGAGARLGADVACADWHDWHLHNEAAVGAHASGCSARA